MHNKLIIADGAIAVTGGRNISREYFDASENFQFTDMDILFYGNAVDNANQVFQDFWNDDLSYSVPQLLGNATQEQLSKLRKYYELTAFKNHKKDWNWKSKSRFKRSQLGHIADRRIKFVARHQEIN